MISQKRKRANLIDSIIEGDEYTVRQLIRNGADIFENDQNGISPFTRAVNMGNKSIINTLVTYGYDSNSTENNLFPIGISPLSYASHNDNIELFKILIEKDAPTYNVDIKDEHVLYLKSHDVISLTDKSVEEFLTESSTHMVILDGNNPLFVHIDQVTSLMEDSVVFECKSIGNISLENVKHDTELFNAIKLGFVSGYIINSSMRKAMRQAVTGEKRIFRLSQPKRRVVSVVGQLIFEARTSADSANHCTGSGGVVRELEYVNIDTSHTQTIDTEMSEITIDNLHMLVIAKTIQQNSTSNSTLAMNTGKGIEESWEDIGNYKKTLPFQNRIERGTIIISKIDINTLQQLCRIFIPYITSVYCKRINIQDFSFIGDILNLQIFSSSVRINTRSAFQYLYSHLETLNVLSMPIHREMMDISRFKNLEKVRFSDFDVHSGVLEAIGQSKSIKEIELESSDYNGPLDALIGSKVEKITMNLSIFDNSISPLAGLENISELNLNIPMFRGDLSHLSSITNRLEKFRIISRASKDVDTRNMSIYKRHIENLNYLD